jgi:hypothetical protein
MRTIVELAELEMGINPGSIPKVAPTGVESVNRIKDMAEHF